MNADEELTAVRAELADCHLRLTAAANSIEEWKSAAEACFASVKARDAELAEKTAEAERLRQACIKQQHDIQQTLGKSLGYPTFPAEFNAGEQVCVGEHTAESLAEEAAKKIAALHDELPPYTGLIGTGDQFIWAPPGYGFPPKAFAHIEVTDIVFNGEENIIYFCRHNGLGDCYDGPDDWWEESSFRPMVILHQRAKRINEYEPHKYTTDKPRIP